MARETHSCMDRAVYLFQAEWNPGKEGGPGWESGRGPAEPNAAAASAFWAQGLLKYLLSLCAFNL